MKTEIEKKVNDSDSSFYWAMRLMPSKKRQAIFAVYAFCREVDDVADGNLSNQEKTNLIKFWRAEIENIYKGKPNTNLGKSLAIPIESFSLEKQDFMDILDGMELDIDPKFSVINVSELENYCDKVACSVGRLSNDIFGLDKDTGVALADCLGKALQLTNILRDVNEDFQEGKNFLPQDLLESHNGSLCEIKKNICHPSVASSCRSIAKLAQYYYNNSRTIIESCDRKIVKPALLMMLVYERLLNKLIKRNWSDMSESVRINKIEKLWIIVKVNWGNSLN